MQDTILYLKSDEKTQQFHLKIRKATLTLIAGNTTNLAVFLDDMQLIKLESRNCVI